MKSLCFTEVLQSYLVHFKTKYYKCGTPYTTDSIVKQNWTKSGTQKWIKNVISIKVGRKFLSIKPKSNSTRLQCSILETVLDFVQTPASYYISKFYAVSPTLCCPYLRGFTLWRSLLANWKWLIQDWSKRFIYILINVVFIIFIFDANFNAISSWYKCDDSGI